MTLPLRAEGRGYWETSRSNRYSLLFAIPLLLLYELLEAVAPVRSGGGTVRNGADVLLATLASWLLGPRGPMILMGGVIAVALWLAWRDRRAGPIRLRVFGAMFGESLVLALVFGLVVGVATAQLLGPLRPLAAGADVMTSSPLAAFTLSLGAGLYEELLFRVILVALLAKGLRLIGLGRPLAGVIAVIVGALVFSAFHHIGAFGEPFRLEAFTFRAIAGLGFSAMYLLRGFGITAWTHALYDVFVLVV